MNPMGITGRLTFAAAVAGLGIISLSTGHFAAVWQPVPGTLPARTALAYANGALMAALGAALLLRRARAFAALAVSAYLIVWLVLLRVPIVAAAPGIADHWAGIGENATLIVGGLLTLALAPAARTDFQRSITARRAVRLGRIIFALALMLMSLNNLAYLQANADFPPAWIAHWLGWGYLVGLAYIAAGLAVLFGLAARLAAIMTAWMMSALTVLCWGSFVLQAPANRTNWTGLMISSALTGAAWLVASSYAADRRHSSPGSDTAAMTRVARAGP